jgi:hypothetical protein
LIICAAFAILVVGNLVKLCAVDNVKAFGNSDAPRKHQVSSLRSIEKRVRFPLPRSIDNQQLTNKVRQIAFVQQRLTAPGNNVAQASHLRLLNATALLRWPQAGQSAET